MTGINLTTQTVLNIANSVTKLAVIDQNFKFFKRKTLQIAISKTILVAEVSSTKAASVSQRMQILLQLKKLRNVFLKILSTS
jgi:hypothetical protein